MTDFVKDIQTQIVHRDGKVLLLFSKKVKNENQEIKTSFLALEPTVAVNMARAMADMAFEADTRLKPVGDTLKAELIEQHRMKLTQRLSVVLNSAREDRSKSNGVLARELTDIMIREIFT